MAAQEYRKVPAGQAKLAAYVVVESVTTLECKHMRRGYPLMHPRYRTAKENKTIRIQVLGLYQT